MNWLYMLLNTPGSPCGPCGPSGPGGPGLQVIFAGQHLYDGVVSIVSPPWLLASMAIILDRGQNVTVLE